MLYYASEGDVLPVQALGFRGVKDDRRVHHPRIPAPGCVEPPGALLATDTSLCGVVTSSSNHLSSHDRIDEADESNNEVLTLINLTHTILYVCKRVKKKSTHTTYHHASSKGMLALIIMIMMITDSHAVNTRGSST